MGRKWRVVLPSQNCQISYLVCKQAFKYDYTKGFHGLPTLQHNLKKISIKVRMDI